MKSLNNNIKLALPKINGEFMTALNFRKSQRDFNPDKELTLQELSDLLWVIYGNNREHTKRKKGTFLAYKTVPSAFAAYPLIIFVFLKSGVYKYDPENNNLILVKAGDFREKSGGQPYVKNASVNISIWVDWKVYNNLTFAQDFLKMKNNYQRMAFVDAGIICQNIHIFCTVRNMKTITRGMSGNEEELRELLGLDNDCDLVIAQSVGF
jgi:SagB-type dehydrogenase family enzyme